VRWVLGRFFRDFLPPSLPLGCLRLFFDAPPCLFFLKNNFPLSLDSVVDVLQFFSF